MTDFNVAAAGAIEADEDVSLSVSILHVVFDG